MNTISGELSAVTPGLLPAFCALVVVMTALLVWAIHQGTGRERATLAWAFGLTLWLTATVVAASRGLLRFDAVPPTMPILLGLSLGGSLAFALSRVGARIAAGVPLGLLVLSQAFRLPLELIMHRLYEDGVMPVQMSYSGLNFDVLTGVLAVPVGLLLLAGRLPRWVVRAWNVVGLLLLVNVLTIALLSAPVPMRVFMNEPSNVWVTHAPWVWLPTLLVPCALIGHVLVFRRLRLESRVAPSELQRPVAAPTMAP